jgi:5'-AMP-activated protein kinase catalytic alpha subunit
MIRHGFDRAAQPPPTEIDFYRVGKVLGKGAFGKVNLAKHKLARKLVAIKSMNKAFFKDDS